MSALISPLPPITSMNFFLSGASFMTTCKLNIPHIPNAYSVPYTLTTLDGKTNNQKAENKGTLTETEGQGKTAWCLRVLI